MVCKQHYYYLEVARVRFDEICSACWSDNRSGRHGTLSICTGSLIYREHWSPTTVRTLACVSSFICVSLSMTYIKGHWRVRGEGDVSRQSPLCASTPSVTEGTDTLGHREKAIHHCQETAQLAATKWR